ANDHDVALLRFAQDAPCRIANVLEDCSSDAGRGRPGFEVLEEAKNAAMSVQQSGLVAGPFIGSRSHRNGFWSVDRRRVEDAKTEQARVPAFRPLDRKRRRAITVGGAIERDERRSKHGKKTEEYRATVIGP